MYGKFDCEGIVKRRVHGVRPVSGLDSDAVRGHRRSDGVQLYLAEREVISPSLVHVVGAE